MANDTPSASFDTTLSSFGNNTGIEVPESVLQQLGGGKRPAVVVEVNGYTYRTTAGVMKGVTLLPVSAAIRKDTGLQGGDDIHVVVTLATEPRAVTLPDDFATALAGQPAARTFFDNLSNSLQRMHIDNVNGAKTADTRQRRIDKAVQLFLDGKQR
jgi:hypothetical protein